MDDDVAKKVEEEHKKEENFKVNLSTGWKIAIVVGVILFSWLIIAIIQRPIGITDIILKDGMNLSELDCVNFPGNYFFYSPSCTHCDSAMKTINESEDYYNTTYYIRYLNVNDKDTLNLMNEYHVIVSQIPTLIANCKVYVGEKRIDEYYSILSD